MGGHIIRLEGNKKDGKENRLLDRKTWEHGMALAHREGHPVCIRTWLGNKRAGFWSAYWDGWTDGWMDGGGPSCARSCS